MTTEPMIIEELRSKYEATASSRHYENLYEDDEELGHIFSVLHKRLDKHFEDINDRSRSTRHYWADNSRDLLALIDELNEDLHNMSRAGVPVQMSPAYQYALDRCEPWLTRSGGSIIPDDFARIDIIKYEPVFRRDLESVRLKKMDRPVELEFVGEGSYAQVYSYIDPDYGVRFAVKRAKRGIGERDLHRFKKEFEVMKELNFPYIVEVYGFDPGRNEYRMEFCDETLRSYIEGKGRHLSLSTRKRIALQFLYGINYIHAKDLLHRDISLQNVLVKVFDQGAVLVKLSDFGLVKSGKSVFTQTNTHMRGTIRDPYLDDFKSYNVANEIFAIGCVLSFIFSGKEALRPGTGRWWPIIMKCVDHDAGQRYSSVRAIITDVENLRTTPKGSPA